MDAGVGAESPADAEGIARQIVSFSVPACFVIFPERKDETRLRPGGNVFSLHGCGARASGLIKSIFLPQRRLERGKRGKTPRVRPRGWGVIELINLMAFVAHQTSHFSLCCLSSQPERSVYMMKSYGLENRKLR